MRNVCRVTLLASLGLISSAWCQQPDAKALFVKSVRNYDRSWRAGMGWSYTQTDAIRSGGTATVELSEVMPLEGTPYERVIARNGHQLNDQEKRREDQKYEKTLRQRQSETLSERQARIRKYENERAFVKDLPDAYDYALLGEEVLEGRPAWIVGLTPRANFVPTTQRGSMLRHIKGKLWIDKQELQWAKAEAEVIEMISIGWVLARIGPGAKIGLDLTRVAEGVWLPKRIDVDGSARVLMVANKTLKEELTFTSYKRADKTGAEPVLAASAR